MIFSATGHRPERLGGYGDDKLLILIEIATEYLKKTKPKKVITGGALGWDTAVAIAAIRLKIPHLLAVPFVGQECKWPVPAQQRYNKIKTKSDKVVVVCEGAYSVWKMFERDKYMVDNSDRVLAMFDGGLSGTYNTVQYANKQGKQVDNLYEKFIARTKDS